MCVVVAHKCQFLKAIHSGIWGKCVLRIWFMRVPHKLICNCRASKIHKQTNEPSNDRRTDKETSRQRERKGEKQRRRLSRQRNEEFYSDNTNFQEGHEPKKATTNCSPALPLLLLLPLRPICYANVPAEATSMWVPREYISTSAPQCSKFLILL